MKLIILILMVIAGSPSESESYRLPALTVRFNIEDPLYLAKFFKAIASLVADTDAKKEGSILPQLTSNTTQYRKLTSYLLRI